MKKKPKDVTSLRLPDDLREELKKFAVESDVSFTELCVQLLRQALRDHGRGK